MAVSAYDRVTHKGVTMSRIMKRALTWVEAQPGVPVLQCSQGAYNPGGVAASGSTHSAGGSLDIRTSVMSEQQRKATLKALKRGGWAAWYRDERDGFSPHLHCVLFCKDRSSSARWQGDEFDAGRNGLTSQRADRNPWRNPGGPVRFSFRRRKPVPR